MNKENILKVADAIENATLTKDHGIGFNMAYFFESSGHLEDHTHQECGTTACIAGWASLISEKEVAARDDPDVMEDVAMEYLGLSNMQAVDLFYARCVRKPMADITQAEAVRVLRHLAETGKVDWSIIYKGEEAS
jgi:hypothetical protein